MTLEELRKLLKSLKESREAAFGKMLEDPTDANVAAFEKLYQEESNIAARVMLAEQNEAVGKNHIAGEVLKEGTVKVELTESQRFIKSLREAVAVGSTYTALVPTEISAKIDAKRNEIAKLRKYCTVHPCSGDYTIAVEGTGVTVNYVSEGASIPDSTPTLGTVNLKAWTMAALVKVSERVITDLAVNFEAYIVEQIGKAIALKEDHEILLGAGSDAVSGVITKIASVPARVTTAASGTTFTWAELKNFIGTLKAYKPYSIIVMAQSTLDHISEFKDGNNYIFPQDKEITNIKGLPVVISPDMDEIAVGKTVIVAGDFGYYHLADRQGLEIRVLNERYADTGQVGIRATYRIDGNLTLNEAFSVFKMKGA